MTTTKSQTTTPSGADVLSTRRFAMKAAPCGVSMEEVDPDARGFVYYLCSDIDPAVAALLARNAEMEAEQADRDAVIDCKNIDIRERDASIKGWADRARKAESDCDALAAENKALREAMLTVRMSIRFKSLSAEQQTAIDAALARTPANGETNNAPD